MKANLHFHSRHSDGSLWPSQIAAIAKRVGLELIALTDHDTLGGVGEIMATAEARGIRAIPACEIDCSAEEIHYRSELLAYFPRGDYYRTQSFLKGISRSRIDRLKSFIEQAASKYSRDDLAFEDLARQKLGARWGALNLEDISFSKVDFYSYLKDKNLVPRQMAYKDFKSAFFESGLIGDKHFPRPSTEDVVRAVKEDGGYVVLPHPCHEFDDDLDTLLAERRRLTKMLDYFLRIGVEGVELYYYRTENDNAINHAIWKEADPLGYFFTYGSDCHGPGTEKFTIEEFWGDFKGFPKIEPVSGAFPQMRNR